jgi:hypothetical protein
VVLGVARVLIRGGDAELGEERGDGNERARSRRRTFESEPGGLHGREVTDCGVGGYMGPPVIGLFWIRGRWGFSVGTGHGQGWDKHVGSDWRVGPGWVSDGIFWAA